MSTQQDPLVSIPICVYNHEKYIAECLDGILMQKVNFKYEVILGDDGSVDDSKGVIERYRSKYPDIIKPVYRPENIGAQANAADVLARCKGKYIATCDSDDYWCDPDKLQMQVDLLESRPDLVLCQHWHKYARPQEDGTYQIADAPKNLENDGYYPNEVVTVRDLLAHKFRIKTRTLVYRNILKGLPPWFTKIAYGDDALGVLLGKYGKFGYIDRPMAVYRITNTGQASGIRKSKMAFAKSRINWIEILNYANIYHDRKYEIEVVSTVTKYCMQLVRRLRVSEFHITVPMILFIIFRTTLPVGDKLQIVSSILIQFPKKLALRG